MCAASPTVSNASDTVRLIDFCRAEDGTPFLVFELLTGESLDALLAREGALRADRVTRMPRGPLPARPARSNPRAEPPR